MAEGTFRTGEFRRPFLQKDNVKRTTNFFGQDRFIVEGSILHDLRNSFTVNNISYSVLTDEEFTQLTDGEYFTRRADFYTFIGVVSSSLITTLNGQANGNDIVLCPPQLAPTTTTLIPCPIVISRVDVSNVTLNGLKDGIVDIIATSINPLTYTIKGITQTSNRFTGLSADTYFYTVTDDAANCNLVQTVTVTEPPACDIEFGTVLTDDPSEEGFSDGSIIVPFIGNVGTVTYKLNGGGATPITAIELTNQIFTITGLPAGDHTIQLFDDGSPDCETSIITATIIPGPATTTTAVPTTALPCTVTASAVITQHPSAANNDGQVTIVGNSVQGGITRWELQRNGTWISNVTTGSGNAKTFTGLSAASYKGSVTDSRTDKNCISTPSNTVTLIAAATTTTTTIPPTISPTTTTTTAGPLPPCSLSFNAAGTNVSVNGGTNGTITLIINVGGSGGLYLYEINGPGGLKQFSTSQVSHQFTSLAAGTYTTKITDNGSCSGNRIFAGSNVTLTQPAACTLAIVSNTIIGPEIGQLTVKASNSSDNRYLFQLFVNGGAPVGSEVLNTGGQHTYTGLAAGTYTWRVRDKGLFDLGITCEQISGAETVLAATTTTTTTVQPFGVNFGVVSFSEGGASGTRSPSTIQFSVIGNGGTGGVTFPFDFNFYVVILTSSAAGSGISYKGTNHSNSNPTITLGTEKGRLASSTSVATFQISDNSQTIWTFLQSPPSMEPKDGFFQLQVRKVGTTIPMATLSVVVGDVPFG